MLDWIGEWVTSVIETLGYPGLTVLVALENVFPPIPSEVILPLAGFLTGQNRFSFFLVLIATTLGSLIGALVLYAVGLAIGQRRVNSLVERYGQWALLTPEDLTRAEDWFDRYGPVAVFTGRLFPVVRSLVSIPAGYRRMPLGQFLLLTSGGSALWNGALVGLGWALGENWHVIEEYVGWLQYVVIAVVAFLVVRFVWQRLRARRVTGS
ncbi:MAG: DedA family protein [Chloroflexi bacterium]|nr:DedA family protein [Chloroflexota bacterium]